MNLSKWIMDVAIESMKDRIIKAHDSITKCVTLTDNRGLKISKKILFSFSSIGMAQKIYSQSILTCGSAIKQIVE